ncbi:MAG TPA: site-specific integrase [Solimonas sp.]
MGRTGSGVEARDNSIRIHFTHEGQQRKETLKTDGKPLAPTPANLKYAHRLAAEIKDKIRYGTFVYADYFPASRNATTGQGATVGDRLDVWFETLVGKEGSTAKGYRTARDWWKAQIGHVPVRSLVRSQILAALATEPEWSGKTRNNKMSVLRQALQLALADGVIAASPVAGIEAFPHQAPEPDPFSQEEADAIVGGLARHYDEQIARYFEVKFYTGLRTSESLAMRWDWIDWPLKHMGVGAAVVLGEHKERTKTNLVRNVHLNSRALAALKAQKPATFLKPAGWIFPDPRTGERFTDDEPPRELWWRPCLKRLGIRYRSPYETRHTYATMMLMAGMTPAFCARQMGHSVEMFLKTYAKWIDGGRNDVEMGKLEALLGVTKTKANGAD